MRINLKQKLYILFTSLLILICIQGCNVFGSSEFPLATQVPKPVIAPPTLIMPELQNQPVNTDTPKPTQPLFTPTPDYGIVWQARFEIGDLSEILQHGDFVRQGSSASYNLVSPHAHTGQYSVALTIDTTAPSSTGAHSAYLFFWDTQLIPDDAYYYSAWFYIPSKIKPGQWWNIWQFLSNPIENAGEDWIPLFIMDILQGNDGLDLVVYQRIDLNDSDNKVKYVQDVMHVPQDKWFQIEAYYKKAQDMSGQIVIWLDGVEVFNIIGVQTALSNNQVIWALNNYAEHIEPNPCTIFVDDMFISKNRIGPISLPLQ